MESSEFIFDCAHSLYYKCHKINLNRGGSYVESPDWIKNKKVTINPINKKGKCFQYTIKVALSHEEIGKHPEKITKIKSFVNKYNWEEINYLLEKDDCKKFETDEIAIAFNVLFAKNEKQISCLHFKT